jgi:FkbM family methyltransferase
LRPAAGCKSADSKSPSIVHDPKVNVVNMQYVYNYKKGKLPKIGHIKLIDLPIGRWIDAETIIIESISESPFYISLEKNSEECFNSYCLAMKESGQSLNEISWFNFIKLKNDIERDGFKSPSEANGFPAIVVTDQHGQLDGHRRLAIVAHLYGLNTTVWINNGSIAFDGANLKGNVVSFAQNYEDVMLLRVFKEIKNGFYIDVGANHPEEGSVTKVFYDRGWYGINIEPVRSQYLELNAARNRDINLLCAAGDRNGHIDLWESKVLGWSTASLDVIAMHQKNGHVGVFQKVPVFLLRDICTQYAEKEIHFIKIDVEGFEREVIFGMDFTKFRPWVVVVEATKPNSQVEVHLEWEDMLFSAEYIFAYADGLNRFYLASERKDLLAYFRYPPNVFDNYVRFDHYDAKIKVGLIEAKIQQAEAKAHQAEAKAHQAEQKLLFILQSRSWRATLPFRLIMHNVRRFAHGVACLKLKLTLMLRSLLRYAMQFLHNWVNSRPNLARRVRSVLNRFPKIKVRLLRLSQFNFVVHHGSGFAEDRWRAPLLREQIVRAPDVKMSFFGSEFSGRAKGVGKLPFYIEAWWRKQQQRNSQLGNAHYGDVGHAYDRRPLKSGERSKILQMTTYSLDNPDHGGKLRSYHIRQVLRARFDVQTLSFQWEEYSDSSTKSVVLDSRKRGTLGIDGVTSDFGINTYLDAEANCYLQVCNLVRDYSPDAIILEQPFLWPLIERFIHDGIIHREIKLIYSSHNIESDIKREIYKKYYPAIIGTKYAAYVDAVEKAAIRGCSGAIAVTSSDAAYMLDVCSNKRITVYANGHSRLGATSEDEKWRNHFVVQERNWVFVGSCHPPNINGLRDLLAALKLRDDSMSDVALWVLGSVGNCFLNEAVNFRQKDFPWLHIVGPMTNDDITSAIMCSSGIILPIWEGGGSNLKTAQALLSGKCVLGSDFSFRGFEHFRNEAGVSLTSDAGGLARLLIETHPLKHYPRTESVSSLEWECILETLPEFVHDLVVQDDGIS